MQSLVSTLLDGKCCLIDGTMLSEFVRMLSQQSRQVDCLIMIGRVWSDESDTGADTGCQ